MNSKNLKEVYFGKDDFIELNGARFICIYLLHISVIPEIKSALGIIRFITNNQNEFRGNSGILNPFMTGFLKFIAGLITEGMSVIMIISTESVDDVVKDFIAFNIIKEVDNMMLMTVSNCDVEEEFDDSVIKYPESQ